MAWFDTLIQWSHHISTIMIISGALHLALVGIRKAELYETHPVKKWGEPGVSAALFPVGILQFVSFIVYAICVITGARNPALIVPPEYATYGVAATALYGISMLFGSMSAIGQAGRKIPWAVLTGLCTGGFGGGSVWFAINGLPLDPIAVAGGSFAIGLILFLSMFYITLPGQEFVKLAGDFFAFSPPCIANGALMSVLGIFSAMGLVVL